MCLLQFTATIETKVNGHVEQKVQRIHKINCQLSIMSLGSVLWSDLICDFLKITETSTCVLSNSGLSNATSKRLKLAFFRGKICPPQSRKCQNQILHISKINFYFGFHWYSKYSQCRLVLNIFEFLWRYVEKMASAVGKLAKIGIRTPLKLYVYFWFVS